MNKLIFVLILSFVIGLVILVSATEYSGDGTYTVQIGDIITLENSWQIEILGVFMTPAGEQLYFRALDPEGKNYPSPPNQNSLSKYEGKEKYGTDTLLKIEIELLEVLGGTTPTGSPMVTQYEKAKVNVVSIDESLPGAVTGGDESVDETYFEDINKDLTYKNGRSVLLNIGEEIILGNGYKLKLDRFDSTLGSPYFSLYSSDDNLIDEGIAMGKDVGASLGSFVYVKDYTTDSVDLLIIDGSKLTFGTGWNMFSIHIEDGDGYGTVLESTCNGASMWLWDNKLDDYKKLGILEEGARIPAGKGIWAKIQTKKDTQSDVDCEVIVSGIKGVSIKGIKLNAGWNLIGAPISAYGNREVFDGGSTFNLLSFENILGDCKLDKGPWQYLGTKYSDFSIKSEVAEQYKFSEPFQDNLRLNRGYFIKVAGDCTLNDI